ncbi:MAG: hypothetical protein WDO06_10010 [Actinomycetota bacterium]
MIRPFEVQGKSIGEIADFLDVPIADREIQITGMTHVSGDVLPGDLFFGFPGANFHGASFVDEARTRGAGRVSDGYRWREKFAKNFPALVVTDPRRTAGNA